MTSTIRFRIALPFLALILVVMAALAIYLLAFVGQNATATQTEDLIIQAQLAADALAAPLAQTPSAQLAEQTARLAQKTGARVTVMAASGEVLADSEADPAEMESHLFRPEVQSALAVGRGSAVRYSDTMRQRMLYVAVPVLEGGAPQAVVRLALSLADLDRDLAGIRRAIVLTTAVAAALTVALAFGIAERILRPLRRLRTAMEAVIRGDYRTHLIPSSRDEIGLLTGAYNQMADYLRATITRLNEERAQLRSVLHHMADGVLITNGEGRVRMLNPAAASILGVDVNQAMERSFAQVVHEHQIIDVWQALRQTGEAQEQLIEMAPRGRFLRIVASPLATIEPGASLIIVQDLSQIRRLETVRRDFVSNLSHELRTPLAALKALADTLREGALEDPPAAQRFLDRMDSEIDALTQMVAELLELSRIESGQVPMRLVPVSVAEVVLPAVERLRAQAERAEVSVAVDLPESLPRVLGDEARLTQVVSNLVHNAIKFTPPGGAVTLWTERRAAELVVVVRDTGIGIPADVLPRIFERFYKLDRARSEGGTGLGLAIAKHIVQAHGGEIWAESVEGQGSTFRFSLLIADQ